MEIYRTESKGLEDVDLQYAKVLYPQQNLLIVS